MGLFIFVSPGNYLFCWLSHLSWVFLHSNGKCPDSKSPPAPTLAWSRFQMGDTHIRLEGRLQHACSQTLEVQFLEEGVLLHLTSTTPMTAQTLSRVLAKEL